MIIRIELRAPRQRGDTQDPSIEKMIFYRIERWIGLDTITG